MKKMAVVGLIVLAGAIPSYAELTGNWVTLTNNTVNKLGVTNGWNASYWDDGRDPHPDADYRVADGKICHTPRWGLEKGTPTNCVFGGNSLVLTNGSQLGLVCVDTKRLLTAPIRITVPNDGIIVARGGNGSQFSHYESGYANVFGKMTIEDSNFTFYSSKGGAEKEKTTVLWGDFKGDITSGCTVNGYSPRFTLRLAGECSQYFGKITVGTSAVSNDLDLCSVVLPGLIEVKKGSRIQLASSAYQASVGSLTLKDGAILGVSVDGASSNNGTLTVSDVFLQEGGFLIALTNYMDVTATVSAPSKPVLKLAADVTGTVDISRITVSPATDATGNKYLPMLYNEPDGSALLMVFCEHKIGEDTIGTIGLSVDVDSEGKAAVSASGTVGRLMLAYSSFANLLASAKLRLDANASAKIDYIDDSADPIGQYDKEGRPYVKNWKNVNACTDFYMRKWTHNGDKSGSTGEPIRHVAAYPTVQKQIVNGIERAYMDFGQIDGSNGLTDTNINGTNTTAAAMESSEDKTLSGVEYHVVHADAHSNALVRVNGTGAEWRPPILGRTNTLSAPNRTPGRRGVNGELFIKSRLNAEEWYVSTDAFTADGCVYVDNFATNYTYVPEWGDVHVYTLIPTNALVSGQAFGGFCALGSDTYGRYGGLRMGELLVYDSMTNSTLQRKRIDDYLMKKWMNVGAGPQFEIIKSVTLSDAAYVSLTTDIGQELDVGCETVIGTLSGDGTLHVNENDSIYVENIQISLAAKDVCDSLTILGGRTILAHNGTLTVLKPEGIRRVGGGTYVLLSAAEGSDLTALEDWTIDVTSLGIDGVRIYRSENSICMDVPKPGLVMIVR